MKEDLSFFACSYQYSPFPPKIRESEISYFLQLLTIYLAVYFQIQFEQIVPLLAIKISLVHNIKPSLLNLRSHLCLLQNGIFEASY